MLFDVDTQKRQALIDLMSLPDSPDLRRGHHKTVEGRPDRHLLVRHLTATFVQWHQIELEERAADWASA